MTPAYLDKAARIALMGLSFLILVAGLYLLAGGGYLIHLGGSWYFALAGLGLLVTAVLLILRKPLGLVVYLAVLACTTIWALADAGFSFWPLVSRLFAPVLIAVPLLLLVPRLGAVPRKGSWRVGLAVVLTLGLAATVAAAFKLMPLVPADRASSRQAGLAAAPAEGGDWRFWGRTATGTRYAPLSRIAPSNVAALKVAWTYRTGDIPHGPYAAFALTPLQVDDRLYGCTQTDRIFALDAETGQPVWQFDAKAKPLFHARCRGLGYYDGSPPASATSQLAADPCLRRIIATTVDARLLALDAVTGAPCQDFGDHGVVDLGLGMGEMTPGFYFQTSAPTVVRDLIVVGGLVQDNQEIGEPSGVVRAFNVRTGALAWAWDLGKTPGQAATGPYTRGTPNVWSAPSFDDALGLIYLPTGNGTPDFWGGKRSALTDRYSSSVVALDIATGQVRWSFQTVHHDLWDYDVPAQPVLYDLLDGHGGTQPALIQPTKRGQMFLLDRRTGSPIARVEERPVPQAGSADDERMSPTQPYSTGMPALGAERLSEQAMWGLTPLDQLACRIAFRKARYDGDFTPPGATPGIQYPSWVGGMNWGSASVAENLGLLIVNDTRMAGLLQLEPRAAYDASHHRRRGETIAPQFGTPWGMWQKLFLSPLGVPCQQPPYGAITAIDLVSRKVIWSMPLGTLQDSGPRNLGKLPPIPIGLPSLGGPITTASGLVFMAGTQDHYIRALDVRTGRELWKGRLPLGAETTPMTYVSPHSGRQFVVVSAGGNQDQAGRGDYVIAFALPG